MLSHQSFSVSCRDPAGTLLLQFHQEASGITDMPDSLLAVKETWSSDFGFRTNFQEHFCSWQKDLRSQTQASCNPFPLWEICPHAYSGGDENAESNLCTYKRSQQRRCYQEASWADSRLSTRGFVGIFMRPRSRSGGDPGEITCICTSSSSGSGNHWWEAESLNTFLNLLPLQSFSACMLLC